MNPFAWFDRAADIVQELVPDGDRRAELQAQLEIGRQQAYIAELQTDTVPWMDGVHKLARTFISIFSIVGGLVAIYIKPDIDPLTLGALVAPGGIYNAVKGKGLSTR